ncbi:hypothetical protein BKA70DRAFT_693347 [Coprinopsis sp. MPI-PUGE-AT-0042]|nr:hypothetical protein BKA70DRAFT_693347 [Coprinopsis sp. MPI-PUGE-AT-0042]
MAAPRAQHPTHLTPQEKVQHHQGHALDLKMQSPFCLVPPEIWVIIFRLVLGDAPFGRREREAYVRLRSVCTLWKEAAAAPGLCPGLDVTLDDWVGESEPNSCRWVQSDVETRLAPWLAILNPIQPYVLRMRLLDGTQFNSTEVEQLTRLFLTTTPSPSSVALDDATTFAVFSYTSHYATVGQLQLYLNKKLDCYRGIQWLQRIFPNLKTLLINACWELGVTFKHPHLQCLTLTEMVGFPEDFQNLLQDLPSLRELKVRSPNAYYPDFGEVRGTTKVLSSIEVLVVTGESFAAEILSHFTFPCLKFLGFQAIGRVEDTDIAIRTYSEFLSRSRLTNCTISIRGQPTRSFFAAFVESLPPYARLHCNIQYFPSGEGVRPLGPSPVEEIYCPNLVWLDGPLLQRGNPAKIFVAPQSDAPGEEAKSRRKELEELGYFVEVCSLDTMESRLRSQVPWMSIDWKLWSI